MEAIVLAGGLGTRLGAIASRQPKPMVPVAGRPFLSFVLDYLADHGVRRVVLSVGHYGEQIQAHFGNCWKHVTLDYVFDPQPLGTGGAILNSLQAIQTEHVIVVNGDTLYSVPVNAMWTFHCDRDADLTMALKPMQNFERYGAVRLDGERLVAFEEKRFVADGLVNGGVYCLRSDVFSRCGFSADSGPFSFESDFMPQKLQDVDAYGFVSDAYFIDIGVPEDYERANLELSTSV